MLTQWYSPEPGGGAVPSVLARDLSQNGHNVKVLTGFPNYPSGKIYDGYRQSARFVEQSDFDVTIRRVPLIPSHDSNPIGRVANYLSFSASAHLAAASTFSDRDALWVYNSPETVGTVARVLRKRKGVPYLLHVMDLWPDSVLESGMLKNRHIRSVARPALNKLVDYVHSDASHVAVTSPGQAAVLEARGVPSSRISYIPVWADETTFFPRQADRSLLPEQARDANLVVMYAGAMGHVQRLDVLVRAVVHAGTGIHLVMVGSGVALQGLQDLKSELDASNVHFVGSQPPTSMGALGSAADVHFVSLADSPLLRVTMPSKVQSILAMGRPIMAVCAGDAAGVVESAGAGLTFPTGSVEEISGALRQLERDPAQLSRWGEAGRRYYAAEFSSERAMSRVETALRNMIV